MGSCTSAIGSQTSEFVGRSITCMMENIKMWNSWFWEDIPHQNGHIFGKVPNGLWHPPSFLGNQNCKAFGAFKSCQNALKNSNCWKKILWKDFFPSSLCWKSLVSNFSENSSVLVRGGFPEDGNKGCLRVDRFLLQIYALLSVKCSSLKMCQCKKMDQYEVWRLP